jgi:hypothetical protein
LSPAPAPPAVAPSAPSQPRLWTAWLVAVVALAAALAELSRFWPIARSLWIEVVSDRNSHYAFAQDLALALREGDLFGFVASVDKAKAWPPLHGLIDGTLLTLTGPDYRLGVLPSLLAWAATALLAFLIARRVAPRHGDLAGAVAAAFVLSSPAHRLFAVDIMLESLGAALTLAVLHTYVVARQEPATRHWRRVGIALSLLFFEKYNYWVIAVLALAAAELADRPAWWLEQLRAAAPRIAKADWRRQWREPLNYPPAIVALLVALLYALGPTAVTIAERRISLYPPENLTTLAYALLLLRLAVAERRGELGPRPPRDSAAWQLWCWHGLPVAVYLLLPRRLSALVHYVTAANVGETPVYDVVLTARIYGAAAATDYHQAAWSALLAGALLIAGLLTVRRWRPGGSAVLLTVLVATTLVLMHPNVKGRFLHSWIAAAWVCGAVGLVTLADRAFGRWPGGRGLIPGGAGLLVVLLLAGLAWPPPYERRPDGGSSLDIAALYLPALAGTKRVAAFANEPIKDLALWTWRDLYRTRDGLRWANEIVCERPGDRVEPGLAAWRARGDEALLFIDLAPRSTYSPDLWNQAACAELPRLMARDPGFVEAGQWRRPADGVTVTLWRRVAAAAD